MKQPSPAPDDAPGFQPPPCPVCGKMMRLQGPEPDIHYVNLDQYKFTCDCGCTADKLVARRN